MRRLLFVDDEQQVLDAMRNLLRRQRKQWDMVFALSGAVALEEMKKAPFDVVVSDMRMPEMDGCALLEQVRALYPGTARIVLSGHAEPETIKRALAVAHQFLSKPCDSEMLRTSIERTTRLHSTLMAEPIRKIVAAMEAAPTLPKTYFELAQAAASPEFDVANLSAIFDREPALSARALPAINNPMIGLPQRVSSIQQAAQLLGADWTKALALAVSVTEACDTVPIEGLSIERLWAGQLLAGRIARSFFRDPQRGQDAFTASGSQGVGEMIAALGAREAFIEVERRVREGGAREAIERELLGATCAEIAAHALGAFGVQFAIVEAVAFSREPAKVAEGQREILAAVHAAHAFVSGTEPDAAFLESAKLTEELPRWRALAEQQLASRQAAA